MDQSINSNILEGALLIARTLRDAGHAIYFVGGCVRDELLGLPLKDIDIATDARPEKIQQLFPDARMVGAKFGVALVRWGSIDYEIATFRRDGVYLDHRHPADVSFGSMEEDAWRRDFTMNALYRDPIEDRIIDLAGGMNDLRNGIIRCVGEPLKRFNEDALRLLRAVRFAARFNFKIEPVTWSAMKDLAHTIVYISPERQRDELSGILTGPAPGRGLRMLDEAGLLHWVLPEIEAMKGVEQGRTWHPEGDVFRHTCLVLDMLEERTTVNAWAALLHDVGKPPTYRRGDDGSISFYDHQSVGAEMAREILGRLRFSNDDIEAVSCVVARHMQFMNVLKMRPSTLRRFLAAPTIESDLAVHRADCLGSHGNLANYDFLIEKRREFDAAREPILPPPLVNGDDLLQLGYLPGPLLGRILRAIQEKQLDGEIATTEEALDWAQTEYPPP